MNRREPIFPLIVAAALALLAHGIGIPMLGLLLTGDASKPWASAEVDGSTHPAAENRALGPVEPEPVDLPDDPIASNDPPTTEAPVLPVPPFPPVPPEPTPEVQVGRDDAPPIVTVAWISHEDYQRVMARESVTEQAALALVDPQPGAPMRPDATPPGDMPMEAADGAPGGVRNPPSPSPTESEKAPPVAEPRATVNPPQPLEVESADAQTRPTTPPPALRPGQPDAASDQGDAMAVDDQNREAQEEVLEVLPPIALAGQPQLDEGQVARGEVRPRTDREPQEAQTEVKEQHQATQGEPESQGQVDAPPMPEAVDSPDPPTRLALADIPQPQVPAVPIEDANDATGEPGREAIAATAPSPDPTSATKSDSESPPVSLTKTPLKMHPGAVITGQGIKITTVVPRIHIIARMSIIPRNPLVKVTFDRNGQVTTARFIRNTGYENWDGPVLASLYQWRASGEKLAEIDGPFEMEIEMLFGK